MVAMAITSPIVQCHRPPPPFDPYACVHGASVRRFESISRPPSTARGLLLIRLAFDLNWSTEDLN